MKHTGEFLDHLTRQLPHPSMTIALVYNVKEEAPPQPVSSAGQAVNPPSSDSLSAPSDPHHAQRIVNDAVGTPCRSNDVYAEWDTMETIAAVRAAIEERYPVAMIEANEDAFRKLMHLRPAFVFNIAEGLHGPSRESQMPAMFEMLRIPYLGSDPLTLGVCLDKSRAKEILSYYRIPNAPFSVVGSLEGFEDLRVRFPAMVKPLHEGSSKGIYNSCVVRNPEEMEKEIRTILEVYREPALVEEFLPGREFTVAMLGNGEDVRALPIVEIKFDALPPGVNPIYSYEAKWIWDKAENPLEIFECPARLDDDLRGEIERVCKDAYRVLNCRDWSRIDIRLDAGGRPNIIEINPLPGILPRPEDNSCFPKAARAAGLSYNELINTVLDTAMKRWGVRVPESQPETSLLT